MERPAWAPPGIDISMPSVSRMHDYYLGGSYNFHADREAARAAMEFLPGLPKIAQTHRAFMRRAVTYAVGEGITQFLDIGAGIPGHGSVREVARTACAEATVVHADHDPVAVAHGRTAVENDPRAAVVAADLRKPRQILDSPEVGELLDLQRPVALLLLAVLHFVDDTDDPYGALAQLRDALAPGSLVVITHAAYEGVPVPQERVDAAADVYRGIRVPVSIRSHEHIAKFFEGYEMVEPGLVSMPLWRPDTPAEQVDPYAFAGLAGVGRTA
ncbi:SAM-dependent methyltransferase [Streptomyces sp. NPDC020965]|uniref:SAM-dependent methyltransferase n=1 Tax=Streptomyces sp. NPDC020965 TaxID=3365105 RepID=UPI00379852B2